MKKIMFIISLLLVQFTYAQTFNVDNLIKLRGMTQTEIQTYLTNANPNWEYAGFDNGEHFWSLDKGDINKNIMLVLTVSLEGSHKNIINIFTADEEINNQIMKQILQYKMKKTSSDNNTANGEKSLLERYEGTNYLIAIKKSFNDNGVLTTRTLLGKK